MPASARAGFGWRATALVAVTYVYFLIYAQFAFLARMAELGLAEGGLRPIMGLMAAAGIATSLLAGYRSEGARPLVRLAVAFGLCAVAALGALAPLSVAGCAVVAASIGMGLGLLTVTLVTFLPRFTGCAPLFEVGLGTGVGYLICNVPAVFTATPRAQSLLAAGICAVGLVMVLIPAALATGLADARAERVGRELPFGLVLAGFAALVWFDSAAFFIIQSTRELKAGTWAGEAHLWANGALHLLAALACAWLLERGGVVVAQRVAVVLLGVACLLLGNGHVQAASLFYPVGVSLYSVALVAYPALLSAEAGVRERGRRAAWLYAIAGWIASGLGIGMAQHLGRVPLWFVALAGGVVLLPWLRGIVGARWREVAAVAGMMLVAGAAQRMLGGADGPATTDTASAIARGRAVYIQEGCIHCHSQYVRPGTQDVLLWGPAQTLEEVRAQKPPLIGNRRQGPDLSEVGSRRSTLWLTAHFYDPRALMPQSFMPSYAYLFAKGSTRGADLGAFLASLRAGDASAQARRRAAWELEAGGDVSQGAQLYARYCQTCHGEGGAVRERWRREFRVLPPDIAAGELPLLAGVASPEDRRQRLAHILRFGIAGTDMPGHEYLPQEDIAALTAWLLQQGPQLSTTSFQKTKGHP